MRLEGKVALITGAGTGIGRASALLFAEEGARIVVIGRRDENIKETVLLVEKTGGEAISIRADVSKSSEVKKMVEVSIKAFGKIDVLFNNAGVGYSSKYFMGPAVDTPVDDLDAVININLKGVFFASKYVIPHMAKNGGGTIINCSSINGVIGCGADSYTATKGGIIALTRSLAVDNAKYNIRVNTVSPGPTETPMIEGALQKKDFKDYWYNAAPIKRIAKARDVAYAALFLASEESSFITGQNLMVDGGLSIS